MATSQQGLELERVHAMYPSLAYSVPPAPVTTLVPNADPREQFAPVAKQVRDGTFRLRCPAESPAGLIGPFLGHGACLDPLKPPESTILCWYDPSEPAQDGDCVLVQMDPNLIAAAVERGRKVPGWIEMYGENPGLLACKMLRHIDGRHMLLTNTSSFWLIEPGSNGYRNQILGTMRYIMIDGVPAYGSGPDDGGCSGLFTDRSIDIGEASGSVDSSRIDLEAVTEITSASDSSQSLSNGGGNVIQAILSPIGIDYTLIVTASLNVWITNDGGGTPEFSIRVFGNSGGLDVNSEAAVPSATASPGERITLQVEVPIEPADEAGTFGAQVEWTGGQPGGTAEARNISLRVEGVKR